MLQQTSHPAEALAGFEQESVILNKLPSRGNPGTRGSMALCESKKAVAQLALGRPGDARTSCHRAISMQENLLKAKPADTNDRSGWRGACCGPAR
jgi:hypothetical protein